MHRDRRIKVGWFHQHQIEALDPTDTPLDIIRRALPAESEALRRSRIAQFGLTRDKAETTVADLSGGERARLLLNLVAMDAPHLLILDEPTNHLDIDSRRALLDALNDYEGAVILITHDRSLMELVADRLWLAADGGVKPFDGDMDDYAKTVLERASGRRAGRPRLSRRAAAKGRAAGAGAAEAQAGGSGGNPGAGNPGRGRGSTRPWPIRPCSARDPTHAADLGRRRVRTQEAVDKAEAAWLAAAEAYEMAGAEPIRT